MSLSSAEEHGVRSILGMIPQYDLIPLVSTLTNGLVKVNNVEDAIQSLLKYCKDSLDILKRKKITKDVLFKYLKESNVDVSPRCDKAELIHKCMSHWKVSSITTEAIDWEMAEMDTSIEAPEFILQPFSLTTEALMSMGLNFAQWFYNLLNDVNTDSVFGPQHFWSDSICNTTISNGNGQDMCLSVTGAVETVEAIRRAVNHFQYRFEPNLYKDVKCDMDGHGLVKICVNGVIYKHNQPDGVFESSFGLIKDPAACDSNWKIKYLEMRWKVNSVYTYQIA
ncbi:uncharacterized protein C3orf38 homolog [Tetranychus urticae]|uniref:NTF2 domain-containing protein n=1 Tax=Tetranychus urticae TaxID=32264 RepID=T1L3Y5_TETUR|nr:uncharacterized protein C3orf38 homolog [Tetranychus urticae]